MAFSTRISPLNFTQCEDPTSKEERERRLASPELGITETDHMAIAKYADGKWRDAGISPFSSFSLHPGSKCFQYGQTIFEGMQAFQTDEGKIFLFRPHESAKRFNRSADRIAMPALPEDLFLSLVKALVWVERDWIPRGDGGRLYVRPFMFATGNSVRFGVAKEYTFCVLVSPARAFFNRDVLKVYVEPTLKRASPGGTGSAKCGGNYAAALVSHQRAERHGCDQALFLGVDGKIQELEVTNIFFVMMDGKLLTPCLDDTVLGGITRLSVIRLAEMHSIHVEERDYYLEQLRKDAVEGGVKEAFACGTAGGLVAIGSFYIPTDEAGADGQKPGEIIDIGNGAMGELTKKLRSHLLAIQTGQAEDLFGWRSEVSAHDQPSLDE